VRLVKLLSYTLTYVHAKFQVDTSNFRTDVFFYTIFRPAARPERVKTRTAVAKKRAIEKARNFLGEESGG